MQVAKKRKVVGSLLSSYEGLNHLDTTALYGLTLRFSISLTSAPNLFFFCKFSIESSLCETSTKMFFGEVGVALHGLIDAGFVVARGIPSLQNKS